MELLAKYRFGDMDVRIDGDLLFMEAHGPLTPEAAQQILQLFRLMSEQRGQFFMLVDLKEGGGVPAPVRRLLAEGTLSHAPAAVAFYGASLPVRGANALMIAAIKIVGGPRQNVTYFSTAAAAQEGIASERQRLAAL